MAHAMTSIDFTDSILDSRDLIQRLEWLSDEDELDDDEQEEMATLKAFENAFSDCDDWKYGVSIINGSYWVEYCKELVTDCGYISSDFPNWIEIDWEATAENISADYSSEVIDGSMWYAR